jgi:hypothetical protein
LSVLFSFAAYTIPLQTQKYCLLFNMLCLSEIWIFPVKSLGGIRVPSARVLPKGLAHDRRWMLVDGHNQFLTQRVYPRMALFKLAATADGFEISFNAERLLVSVAQGEQGPAISALVWDSPVEVIEVSRQHSEWFSEHLKIRCKLVAFPEANARQIDPNYAAPDQHVSLADGYPLLIVGQSSLDDLNSRLATPVPMNRFRPNLVFTGGRPYEEDGWKNFAIGQSRFTGVKPCSRCVVTTVDQQTAEKGKEPLATLAKYRSKNGKVFFGQNLLVAYGTYINEGDEIVL